MLFFLQPLMLIHLHTKLSLLSHVRNYHFKVLDLIVQVGIAGARVGSRSQRLLRTTMDATCQASRCLGRHDLNVFALESLCTSASTPVLFIMPRRADLQIG